VGQGEREEPGRQRDLERLLTFVDAIVAIAITLLVLPLVELTKEVHGDTSVADFLSQTDTLPDLWSFLLSFAVIARLWFAQHSTVRHVLSSLDRLSLLLVFWTLTIVFLPFPTALVAKGPEEPATKILYISTITVSTVMLALICRVIERNPQITDGTGPPSSFTAWTNVALLLLALATTLAFPETSYFPMLLLFLDAPLEKLLRRFGRRR
jgi:uncharacterized membrane protein